MKVICEIPIEKCEGSEECPHRIPHEAISYCTEEGPCFSQEVCKCIPVEKYSTPATILEAFEQMKKGKKVLNPNGCEMSLDECDYIRDDGENIYSLSEQNITGEWKI